MSWNGVALEELVKVLLRKSANAMEHKNEKSGYGLDIDIWGIGQLANIACTTAVSN